jgi:hypothetical protein
MKRAQFGQMVHAVKATLQRMEADVMKRLLQTMLAMMVIGSIGCANSKYRMSGETCGPDDPVRKLDANDCTVVPGV